MRKRIFEGLKLIALAVVLALVIRAFIGEVYIVYGESMMPTLHHNDRVIVSKLPERVSDFERGQIVIIDYQAEHGQDIIKRIIALPGDRLAIDGGRVYLNGQVLDEPYLDGTTQGHYSEVTVPENRLFVMGDNRNHSLDSRSGQIGFVEIERVKGRADIVIWPVDSWQIVRN